MPNVYDMDEMAVWSDMVSSSAADKTGSKCHVWVSLTDQGRGKKLRPFIVLKGAKREIQCRIRNFMENV